MTLATSQNIVLAGLVSAGLQSQSQMFLDVSQSRISDNTGSQIFLSDSDSRCPIGSFLTSHF